MEREARIAGKDVGVIDKQKLGPEWRAYTPHYEHEIWRSTGAEIRKAKEREGDREEEEYGMRHEAHDAEVRRVGVVMAARKGDIWHVTHGRESTARREQERRNGKEGDATRSWHMGCPACCSRARGWRWETEEDGKREWRGPGGEKVQARATTMHVVSGQCEAVEGSRKLKREMEGHIKEASKAMQLTREGQGKHKGRHRTVTQTAASKMMWVAAGTLHEGVQASKEQAEALRRVISGDVPEMDKGEGKTENEKAANLRRKKATRAIVRAQEVAATLVHEWRRGRQGERRP